MHRGEVAGQPCEGLHGDDQQGGADRDGHRQAAEQRECGNDEESAARADQSGDQPDDDAVEQHVEDGEFVVGLRRCFPAAADHGDGGGDHHEGERDEQDGAGDEPGQASACVGAGHAGQTEQQPGTPPDASGAGVRDDAGGAGDADDEQRRGDGLLGLHAGQVDQDGHGQDGPAAAQDSETDTDEQGCGDDGGDHWVPRRAATTVSRSVRGPRL